MVLVYDKFMSIFPAEVIERRKTSVANALNNILKNDECLLVLCGAPLQSPGGLDQTYDFLPHPTYFWLTGMRAPHGVSFYSKAEGWIDFVRLPTREEKFWDGAKDEGIIGQDLSRLSDLLARHKFSQIYKIGQLSINDAAWTSAAGSESLERIHLEVNALRRIKDEHEVALILQVADIANKGYQKFRSVLTPGISENELRIEYEAEIQRHGAHGVPYSTIIGTGTNAAVLHAIPTQRKVAADDMILIDAGAQVYDYCVDITRVYPATGSFSSQQQNLYDLVKSMQNKALERCQIGTQWRDVHRTTAAVLAEGFKDLGLMKGDIEEILNTGAISVFYPHGVGHLVGLRVRDVGMPENKNPQKYCGANLRIDLPLKENFIITVEPGCYFIAPLLDDAENRSKYKDFINWNEVEKWKNVGGVRIEDDVLITPQGPRNLTAVVDKL